MNIGDVTNSGYSSAKHLKTNRLEALTEQEVRPAVPTDKSDDNHEIQDSLNISEEARKAHAAEMERKMDLAQAREALDELPDLSPARKQELMDRLSTGYYMQPEVLGQIAARVSKAIS